MSFKYTPSMKTSSNVFENIDSPETVSGNCTICKKYKQAVKIFDRDYIYSGKIINFQKIMSVCFSIQIKNENKQVFLKICHFCAYRLKDAYEFRKLVISAGKVIYKKAGHNHPTSTKNENSAKQKKIYSIIKNESKNYSDHGKKLCNQTSSKLKQNDFIVDDNYENNDDDFNSDGESSTTSEQMRIATGFEKESEFRSCNKRFDFSSLNKSCKTCPKCDEKIEDFYSLLKHYQSHFQGDLCYICGKMCASRSAFTAHVGTHNGIQFICNYCQKSFSKKRALELHISVHHLKILPYSCYECPERFSYELLRKKHLYQAHNIKVGVWPCPTCNKIYFYENILKNHVKMAHQRIRDIPCPHCDKWFVTKAKLNAHLPFHTGIGTRCHLCPKLLTTRAALSEHLKLHNNIRNFKCTLCDKAYVKHYKLKRHVLNSHKLSLM